MTLDWKKINAQAGAKSTPVQPTMASTISKPYVPATVSVPTPGSKKEKEEQRKVIVKNTWMENYNLSLPGGIGKAYANANPEIAQNAVNETNMFLDTVGSKPGIGGTVDRIGLGIMEGLNPGGSTIGNLERTLGQDLNTDKLDKSKAFIGGEMAGYAGQYALTGGVGLEGALMKGATKLPKLANLAKMGKAGTIGANAIGGVASSVVAGLPINITTSLSSTTKDGKVDKAQFAKEMAINTALDMVLGGAIEGVSAWRRFAKLSKEAQEKALKEVAEKTGTDEDELRRLAYESNVRKGKITPDGDTIYGNSTRLSAGELPAPKNVFNKKDAPISKNVVGHSDKAGVDKIKAKNDAYSTIKESLRVESREDREKLAEILRGIDTNEKDAWDNDDFWRGIMDIAKKQTHSELDPERLYPGLKEELRTTGIKISDDLKNTVDFNAVRKSNLGKLKFTKEGREIDKVYNSLSERHPDLFPEIANPADQMQRLIDIADSLKPTKVTIGDAMSDDDLWKGPLSKVWGAVEKYRKTVKDDIFDAPKYKNSKELPKLKRDMGKGQREVPKTITKSEQAVASKTFQFAGKTEKGATLPPMKEMKTDAQGRKLDNRSEAKPDSRTEAILEKLHRDATENRGIAGNGERRLYAESNHPYRAKVDSIAKKFGVDVVFVKPLTKEADFFNGIEMDGKIIISDKSENPIHVVLGHEILHQVKKNHSADFEAFAKIAKANISKEKYAKYAKVLESAGKDAGIEYKDADVLEEMIADFSGEMFNDPTIMRRIFEEDRNLAQKIYDIITDMIKTLQAKIGDDYIVSDGIKNLKKVQDEYVKLMKQAKLNDANPMKKTVNFSLKKEDVMKLNTKLELPDDPLFRESVENTPGAKITNDGLLINVVRYQKPEQSGEMSVRTGVFYLPDGSPNVKHYKTGKNGYGGFEKHSGETLIRKPIFSKGATGGKAPETAYDAINGKGAYQKMRNDVLSAMGWGRTDEGKIYDLLEKYDANPDDAWYIIQNSKGGNTLPYALQENIVAHSVRNAGYDAVVGYSKGRDGKAFISEIFDVREITYPHNEWDSEIHENFKYSLKRDASDPEYVDNRKKAIKEFGTTYHFNEAGYMLPDGKLLDFSGKKESGIPGVRWMDHRDIQSIYDDLSHTDAMNKFISEGNIRMMPESPAVDMSANINPTMEQLDSIKQFINRMAHKDYFAVDFSADDGRSMASLEYDGKVNPNKVISDIQYYFKSGEVPRKSEVDQFRYSLKRGMDAPGAREKAQKELIDSKDADYKEVMDDLEGVNIGETGAWKFASRITGKGVARHKDLTRLADYAFKNSPNGREWFRETVEEPLYKSKGAYAKSVQEKTDLLYNKVVKELGIWKGSKESAGMMWIGEGEKQKFKETVEYTMQNLKEDFDYKMKNGKYAWENILEANNVIRKFYDDYVDSVNGALKEIYPNVEENVEKLYAKAENATLNVGDAIRTKSRNNLGTIESVNGNTIVVHFKNERTGKEASVIVPKDDILPISIWQEVEDAIRGKRLLKRQDYFRHFQEQKGGFLVGLDNIINGATNIDPRLLDVSRTTQPNSKWTGMLQRRISGKVYTEDAVGGMLEYIPQAEYKVHIEPHIPKMRMVIKELKEATVQSRNANSFIEELMMIANDMAGKTTAFDRVFTDILGDERGRKVLNGLSVVSNRVRANAVVGNINTIIAQFFNLPNVVGYSTKHPILLAEGFVKATQARAGDPKAQAILSKSMFLRERYLDRSFRRFDKGIVSDANRFFSYMMELGDKAVADGAFVNFYLQALKEGLDDSQAVLKADEMTRKSVGGRGIAEMPLSQKAKLTKLFAPFQVEVRNAINVLEDLGVKKDVIGIFVGVFGTSFLMNLALEATTGRQIGLNPYGVTFDGIKEGKRAGDIGKELLGNTVSNLPGGSYMAQIGSDYLGLSDYQMQKFFGEQDPSRFGTGNMAIQTLATPVGQAIKQSINPNDKSNIDLLKPALSLGPKFGGKQIERTVRGLQDMTVLPKEKLNLNTGVSLKKQNMPGSYTDTGKLRFPMEDNLANKVIAPTLGTWSTKEGKEYIKNGGKSLGEKQTARVEKSDNPQEQYGKELLQRAYNSADRKISEIKKNDSLTDEQKNKQIVLALREELKAVKESKALTEEQKKQKVLAIQGKILKYQK